MKIVVLGGAGQVGRALDERCRQEGILAEAVRRQHLDIMDADALVAFLRNAGPAVVVNAAGYTRVDKAEADREMAFRINAEGAAVVADACNHLGLPLVHLSTDYVFDGQQHRPYSENDGARPLNVYGESKRAGEQAIRLRHDHHVILRTAWLFGPHGSNFLKTMLQLAEVKDEWGVVCDQCGTPTSTTDLADAIILVSRSAGRREPCWGLYHFAGAEDSTWFEFADSILDAWSRRMRRRPTIIPLTTAQYPADARRPTNSRLDSRLFQNRFGHRAAALSQRIDETVDRLLAGRSLT
jgi:dTDP-4-dehydrorhamnose reductase